MKKVFALILVSVLLLTFSACSETANNKIPQNEPSEQSITASQPEPTPTTKSAPVEDAIGTSKPEQTNNILIAYFSCTGNTKTLAEYAADILLADLYEIQPEVPYTPADLNYNDKSSRSSMEHNDAAARPAISGAVENMEEYDIVLLGYPIWWGQAPRIISTFLEGYDFSGKTIIPFCTSGSSGIGSSATNLHKLCADGVNWLSGARLTSGAGRNDVEEWLDGLGLDFKAGGAFAESGPIEKKDEESNMINISLTFGDSIFLAKFYDNETTRALIAQFPMALNMADLHNNEKHYNFTENLPGKSDEKPANMNAGDIMLWQGNCLVLFYETFSNSYGGYDRLGYVEDVSGLSAALGNGNVEITFAV